MSEEYSPLSLLPTLRRAVLALVFVCVLFTLFTVKVEAASISGQVTNTNGEPLQDVLVILYFFSNEYMFEAVYTDTNVNGEYVLTGFPASTYRLGFIPSSMYRTEYYNNQSNFYAAPGIVFANDDTELNGYDVELALNGRVVGKVLDGEGNPIPNVDVTSYKYPNSGDLPDNSTKTNATGEFVLFILNNNPFKIGFSAGSKYVEEYYNDLSGLESADVLKADVGETITVTVNLSRTRTISGTVTDVHGNGVDAAVLLFVGGENGGSLLLSEQYVRASGTNQYKFDGLRPNKYQIWVVGDTLTPEAYNSKNDNTEQAEILDLTSSIESIMANVAVANRGTITGTVTNRHGEPLKNIKAALYYQDDADWWIEAEQRTDENGNYIFRPSRPTRRYRIKFSSFAYHPNDPYISEYFDNVATLEAAQIITVSNETLLSNINAVLIRPNEVEARFTATPLTGTGELTTNFTDESQGNVTNHNWDFGDGATSTEISPTHTYTMAGLYTVTLTVTGTENQHTETKKNYISVVDTPITELGIQQSAPSGNPQAQPKVGETIYFSATAAGSNVQYLWDFGDDTLAAASAATGQYVQHSYDASGNYTVTLTARNSAHEEVMTMPITVQADEEPVSALALHGPSRAWVNSSISLSATVGVGDNVTYTWDFGDGESDVGQVVQHAYTEVGTYTITLTASNSQGEEQVTSPIVIKYGLLLPKLTRAQ